MVRRALVLLAGLCLLTAPLSAAPFDVEVKNVRAPSGSVSATLELRDVVPDRFRRLIEEGAALHLRVQTELWETRPVWDRLVYPAIVRAFRLVRATPGGGISIGDGAAAQTLVGNPLPIIVDLGNSSRVIDSERYYVHVLATLGTLADRQVDEKISDAVFGRPSETNSLGSLGRLVFRTALQVSDYLQSVTAETRSRQIAGRDVLRKSP